MRKPRKRRGEDGSSHSVWRSYSDMMSGLLLLFVLIMAVCLMQAQRNYTEKLAEQAKSALTQSELDAALQHISQQESELEEKTSTLAQQDATLEQQASTLKEQQSTLAEQASALEELQKLLETKQLTLTQKESELEETKVTLNQRESELAEQESELVDSQEKLSNANKMMADQQQKIDQIIGVKAELIQALNDEFAKNQINVDIDRQTGAILLDSNVLFSFGESDLTEEGMQILDQVLPAYCHVLLGKDYSDYVAEIIIDGYTDSIGDYVSNLALSQGRAFAVAGYLLGTEGMFLSEEESRQLHSKLSANGKSMSNLKVGADGQEDPEASRRVEIKFRLTDEEMLTELQQLMKENRVGEETARG